MTQRVHPGMSLFKLERNESGFTIRHGAETIDLPGDEHEQGPELNAQIWNDRVKVLAVPGPYHPWFSSRLGISCKLVSFPEENPRPVDPDYRLAEEHVSLADGYPVLIIGQASLDDLNRRLEKPVPMNRFRPNLVFLGGEPYEEDSWKTFSVGKNRFAAVKPCSRCVLTTVDQDTGEKGREPLLTLSRYRKNGENIYFGENAIPIDNYEIFENDEITWI